jgi:hypothetical protein
MHQTQAATKEISMLLAIIAATSVAFDGVMLAPPAEVIMRPHRCPLIAKTHQTPLHNVEYVEAMNMNQLLVCKGLLLVKFSGGRRSKPSYFPMDSRAESEQSRLETHCTSHGKRARQYHR